MRTLFLALVLILSTQIWAQEEIFGQWKTIDENTGKARAKVEIFERDGKAWGRILETYPEEGGDPAPICDKCEGEDKDKPIIGMEIIRGMERDGDVWEDGTILDAEHGKTYSCELWVEDGKLMVRGYVAFFFRTQEWLRVE